MTFGYVQAPRRISLQMLNLDDFSPRAKTYAKAGQASPPRCSGQMIAICIFLGHVCKVQKTAYPIRYASEACIFSVEAMRAEYPEVFAKERGRVRDYYGDSVGISDAARFINYL